MISIKSVAIAGGTIVFAASAGFYMQSGSKTEPAPMVKTTQAGLADLPEEVAAPKALLAEPVELAAIALTSAEMAKELRATSDPAKSPITNAGLGRSIALRPEISNSDLGKNSTPDIAPAAAKSAAIQSDFMISPQPWDLENALTRVAAESDELVNPQTADLSEPIAKETCLIDMTGETRAAAMIALRLTAPCQPNARVSFQHGNLTFTVATNDMGIVELDMPALAENALVIATMDDGNAAAIEMEMGSLAFYDRAVVQWQGNTGIEMHAREFGAEYDSEGHVWSGAPRDATYAARGQGGFVTRLGDTGVDNASIAEVYTFPTATATSAGDIELTVEVGVTELNCGRDISAQVIAVSEAIPSALSELQVTLPDCDAVGDYLLLKNLVDDLKIAAR